MAQTNIKWKLVIIIETWNWV